MFWRGAPPKNFENKVKTPLDLLKEIHVWIWVEFGKSKILMH
jgi:hypothetical protein